MRNCMKDLMVNNNDIPERVFCIMLFLEFKVMKIWKKIKFILNPEKQ